MRLFSLIVLTATLALLVGSKAVASTDKTKKAILWAFCGHKYKWCNLGKEAIAVSRCETGGTFSIYSENGQYRGLFQMGEEERGTWGFGNNAWDQATAAYKMYRWTSRHEKGARWHRWSCRPDGTVAY
jgi:hypothetical protein